MKNSNQIVSWALTLAIVLPNVNYGVRYDYSKYGAQDARDIRSATSKLHGTDGKDQSSGKDFVEDFEELLVTKKAQDEKTQKENDLREELSERSDVIGAATDARNQLSLQKKQALEAENKKLKSEKERFAKVGGSNSVVTPINLSGTENCEENLPGDLANMKKISQGTDEVVAFFKKSGLKKNKERSKEFAKNLKDEEERLTKWLLEEYFGKDSSDYADKQKDSKDGGEYNYDDIKDQDKRIAALQKKLEEKVEERNDAFAAVAKMFLDLRKTQADIDAGRAEVAEVAVPAGDAVKSHVEAFMGQAVNFSNNLSSCCNKLRDELNPSAVSTLNGAGLFSQAYTKAAMINKDQADRDTLPGLLLKSTDVRCTDPGDVSANFQAPLQAAVALKSVTDMGALPTFMQQVLESLKGAEAAFNNQMATLKDDTRINEETKKELTEASSTLQNNANQFASSGAFGGVNGGTQQPSAGLGGAPAQPFGQINPAFNNAVGVR